MGLLQKAYETYCAMEKEFAGQYRDGQKEPLAPVFHGITSVQLEITIDENGVFQKNICRLILTAHQKPGK